MKLNKLYILLIISMLITTGCTIDSISPAPVRPAPVHPAPENIVLGAFEPVVVLDVTVEDDVWDIKFITVQFGTATESIVMERDLLVEVQDEKGETLHRFSKQDPRIVYFEEPPEWSKIEKMPKGKLLVSMPYSPEIQNVWLIGQSPTLKDLRESFDIGDEVKQAYEEFEEQIEINPEEIPISTVPVIPIPPPLKKFTLVIYAGEGGTTDPSQGKYKYQEGTQVIVTAQPDYGWKFVGWEGDISSKATDITITMDSDKSVTAYFTKIIKYALSTSISPLWSGSVSPSSGTYDAGTRVNVTANPASGWKFDHWGGDLTGTEYKVTVIMDSDKTAIAHFRRVQEPDQVNDVATGKSSGCGTPPMGLGSLFQSFTPSASPLAGVDLRLRAGGEFPDEGYNTTVKIRSGTFDGAMLGTATTFVPGPQASGVQLMVHFDFSPSIPLTPGDTYVIEWISPVEGGKVLTWMVAEGNPYPGGTEFSCMGIAIPDEDLIFITYTLR